MAIRFAYTDPGPDEGASLGRWVRWGLAVAFVLLVGFALLVSQRPPGLARGVWLSGEGPEQLALEFSTGRGLAAGLAHQLRDGREVVQWGFAGHVNRDGRLQLRWGNNVTLTGTADLEAGVLDARIVPKEGSADQAVFRRTEAENVPGLLARPDLPYRLRAPAAGSGWETAEPSEVGIQPRSVERTIQAVAQGEAGLLHSFALVRHGKLVAEEYFHGYRRDDLHEIESSTKSVASLLVGIALDRGRIESLGEPVLSYFEAYLDDLGQGWEEVTLRHLLTMQAGVDWEGDEGREAIGTGKRLFRNVLRRDIVHTPGSRWLYNNLEINLLAEVLRQATGLHADAFAARRLFTPLGISEWDWESDKRDGYPSLAGTLHLRSLDMAKIGQLVLDGGLWRGERVVSEEWIGESTAPHVETQRDSQRYGYLWWRLGAPIGVSEFPVIIAQGWGSQFIHVIPELDTVVVTTGGNQLNHKNYAIDQVLIRHLIPGVEE